MMTVSIYFCILLSKAIVYQRIKTRIRPPTPTSIFYPNFIAKSSITSTNIPFKPMKNCFLRITVPT